MRCIVYEKPQQLKYTTTYTAPQITHPQDIKLNVSYCGICGTDLKEYLQGPIFFPQMNECNEISGAKLPMVMGHEISGIIEELGEGVKGFDVGDHIIIEPTGTCRDKLHYTKTSDDQEVANKNKSKKEWCAACRKGMYNICSKLSLIGCGIQDGGFAEKIVVHSSHCFKINKSIPMEIVTLIQPIAVSWHAVRVSHFKKGSSVLILGGGPIGLCTILALNGHGCSEIVVSEPIKIRRDLAERMGAQIFNPSEPNSNAESNYEKLKKMSPEGDGYDYCFDCTGLPITLKTGIQCLTYQGKFINVAIWSKTKAVNFYPMDITLQEKTYTGSMCYTHKDYEQVINALENGTITVEKAQHLITNIVPLENGIKDAFEKLLNDKDDTIKILIRP